MTQILIPTISSRIENNSQRSEITTRPVIGFFPLSSSVDDGNILTLTVKVTGGNVQYQWQLSTNGGTIWGDISGATGPSLSFGPVTLSDDGSLIRVVVTNTIGVTVSPPTLISVVVTIISFFDDFNRINQLLESSASWQDLAPVVGTATFNIVSNQLTSTHVGTQNGETSARAVVGLDFGEDYWSRSLLIKLPASTSQSELIGVGINIFSQSTEDGLRSAYYSVHPRSDGSLLGNFVDNNSSITSVIAVAGTISLGQRLVLESSDSTQDITVYVGHIQVAQVNHGTSLEKPGFGARVNSVIQPVVIFDDFEARSGTFPPSDENGFFDDTFWVPAGFLSWNGFRWNYTFFNGGQTDLVVIDSGINDNWEVGYRPTSVEIIIKGDSSAFPANFNIDVQDTTLTSIGASNFGFTSASEVHIFTIPLTFTANDLKQIIFGYDGGSSDSDWFISNIVFTV